VTKDTAALRAQRGEMAAPDHLPSCPRCGNLCGDGGKWCAECGTWLLLDGPRSSDLRSRTMQAGGTAEDPTPTKG
jgi:hypothetical protein